ncbi:MAG: DNA adenine methylase [Nitrososphaerota archaeon]|nr:DNA adenine methylase [Nitrososphaerota archaeon]
METLEKFLGVHASPFLKWAGGKTQLLRTLNRYLPSEFDTYFEPFLGGGALFFYLFSSGRIEKAVISDLNRDLIECYLSVRDDFDSLLDHLRDLQNYATDEHYYYEIARRRFNEIKSNRAEKERVEKSALLLYLNKTCFNGLYRVNKKGEFNVPWGDYKNPRIYDEKNLAAVSTVLNQPGIRIFCSEYKTVEREAKEHDFVYFDPPYQPLSKTSHFTSYNSESFDIKNQQELAQLFHNLATRRCYLMLSNSPGVRSLYEGQNYRIETVKAGRAINSVGSKRSPVDELLVMNY